MYKDQVRAFLSPTEHKVFKKLDTPERIQDYLDKIPQNFSYKEESTLRSPRRMLQKPSAYCFEAAVFAAAVLAYHGREPLILDLRAIEPDVDHVVAVFKENGLWGAISKTNFSVLKYRHQIYKTIRELAMSYFHEYFLDNGTKSFKDYSAPFSLKKFKPETWVTAEEPLEWLAVALDDSRHFPTVPSRLFKKLRRASPAEIEASDMREWRRDKKVRY